MIPGITQLCLKRESLEQDLALAASCGYRAIELVFKDEGQPHIDAGAKELDAVRKACEKAGVAVSSVIATRKDGGSLLSPDAAQREKRAAVLRRALEIAQALGVDGTLLHPGALEANDSYARAWDGLRDGLRAIAPEAEKRGCWIGVENVWNKILLTPGEVRRFCTEVGSPWVGLYLDTANMIHYGFAEMWIRDLGDLIKKVHVKDYSRKSRSFVQLMDGDCNWPAVAAELRKIGFDGALVSEVGGDEACLRETTERIRRIIAL